MNFKNSFLILAASCMMCACAASKADNPFFAEFNTPFGTPPFDEIKMEHYKPAFDKGMQEQNDLIATIVNNQEAPTFENTIVALEKSSPVLDRVSAVFYGLVGAESNDDITELSMTMAPVMSEHSDNIMLNKALFDRINAVYQQKDSLGLNTEQQQLLERTYKSFVRSGANLTDEQQERLREINKELSTLGLTFSNNLLNTDNEFQLFIENESELSGLPEWFRQSAAEEATAAGRPGTWLFTLRNASRLPALQYADNRDLREKIFTAYINRGNNGDKNDNKDILTQTIKLRLERAKLMGYDTYANFVLDNNMAKNSETVMEFLNNLWAYSLPKAKEEAAELQKMMDKEGKGEKLEGWDWWYYTEKLRKEKYNLDEEEIKPYFPIKSVRDGAFMVANKLYGINFNPIEGIQTYHPDVDVFEVTDADGSHIGIFYTDFHPRPGKRFGAWMSSFRKQNGEVRPIIYNVCNFTKPVGDTPSLLTIDEVQTLFHELGHGLHGLLSNTQYTTLAGTGVARDFVELPSQINEHWSMEPEVLKMYAKHYQTGEVMPDSLIAKILNQSTFNQGFMTTELLAAALLDMNLHNLTNTDNLDVVAFENDAMNKLGLISQIPPRYRSTYFNHIIGGYAAGYYSYLWANVLDNDAFQAFKENGIFDQETASKFRTNVLEKGGSDEPMVLYRKFRGADPNIEPMLKNRGMK